MRGRLAVLVVGLLLGCSGEREVVMPKEAVRTPTPRLGASPSARPGARLSPGPGPSHSPSSSLSPSPSLSPGPSHSPSHSPSLSPSPSPSLSPSPGASPGPRAGDGAGAEEVRATIERWRRAWESRDIEKYMAFYGESFRSDRMDRAAWRKHKGGVFSRLDRIEVKLSGLEVKVDGERAEATFAQDYRGGARSDRGRKRLELRREAGGWRIVSEEFKR